MLGTSASPLRKALNDSGLGESIIGGGIEDELRQPVFSLGLKARRRAGLGGAGQLDAAAVGWLDAPPSAPSPAAPLTPPRLRRCPSLSSLQGVKEEDAGKVEALILDTLARLETEGFTQSAVEAAVNTIEFSLR